MILDFAGDFYSKLSPFHDFAREFAKFLISPNLPRPYFIDFSNNMAAVLTDVRLTLSFIWWDAGADLG